MPFLAEQVQSINEGWAILLNSVGTYRLMGIAETRTENREEEGKIVAVKYPAMIDAAGEVTGIDVNNDYSITIYHRVDSITNATNPKEGAFGDSYGREKETANMSLLCLAFRNQIFKPAYWLENLLKDGMPVSSKVQSIQLSHFFPGASSFDKSGLLSREYGVGLDYPELLFFEMKYRIESTYKKGCFINTLNF